MRSIEIIEQFQPEALPQIRYFALIQQVKWFLVAEERYRLYPHPQNLTYRLHSSPNRSKAPDGMQARSALSRHRARRHKTSAIRLKAD
jgi:hypothetical protein